MAASLSLAKGWQVEKSIAKGEGGSVAATTLTVSAKDHGEKVTLRVSCRADGLVSAGLVLSKPTETEDVSETSIARYAQVFIDFPGERKTKILLRSSLSDKHLQFDHSSTPSEDPEADLLGAERWSVEKLVRRLAFSNRVTFRVSIDGSQDFQESFNIAGFKELAAPLAKQCPKLGEWISR